MTEAVNRQTTPAREKESEIKPLTSFRFFAVVFVFLSHLSIFKVFPELSSIYDRFFYEGYVGVTFFFVLSGFILTYKYHSRLASLGLSELKSFYVSRIARIYPVHLLTFVIALPLVYQAMPKDLIGEGIKALLNLTLLQGFVPDMGYYFSFNAPSWSLSGEVFFYTLFPFLLALLIKAHLTTILRAIGFGAAIWSLTFFVVWWLKDIETSHWLFYIAPFFRLSDFLLGVCMCLVFLNIGKMNVSKGVFTFFELVSLSGFFMAYFYFPALPQPFRYGVCYTPFAALIIFVFALRKGYFSDLLSARLLVLGGEISFSFYLLHQLVIRYFVADSFFEINPVFVAFIAFLLTACLSYICYWLYESPARDILRQRFAAPRGRLIRQPEAAPSESAADMNAIAPMRVAGISNKLIWGSVMAMSAIVLITYYPSLRLGFLGEIWNALEAARTLTLPQYLANTLDSHSAVAMYQLLPAVLLFAGYQIFRADSLGYHVLNLVLHLTTVWLLFWTVLEIGKNKRIAILSAMVFAGLPIYAQTVFSPMDQYLGVGPFYLLSVWAWVRFLRTANRRFYALAVAALGLALLVNPASVTLLVTLILVDRLLVRDRLEAKLIQRYALPCLLTLLFISTTLVHSGDSTLLSNVGFQSLRNLAEYLALLLFPWGIDFQIIFALTPLAAAVLIFIAVWKRSNVIAFLGIETVLLLIPYALLSRESFTPRAFYLPAMLFAVAFALLFRCLWGESRYNRYHMLTAVSGALALLLLFNGAGIANAATDWTNVVRRTRQAYREITPRHPTFGEDTYLYFIGPPSTLDLSGLFHARYGDQVSVASSYDDSSLSRVPYPSLQKTEPDRTIISDASQIAGLRQHKSSFVFYFDNDGRSFEVAVDPNAVSRATPTLPVTFNAPIRLEGYEITANTLKTGDTLVLLLYWRAMQKVDGDYTVFVHLMNKRGEMLDGYDSQPHGGKAPTSQWQPGTLIVDNIAFSINANIPSGADYRIGVGLYNAATLERLLLVDDRGVPFADQVIIEPFRVE